MGIEIEVNGHKAKIESVSARCADRAWYKQGILIVTIRFVELVGGVHRFSVELPANYYEKEEFIARVKAGVKAEIETAPPKLIWWSERLEREREKQEALDLVVDEIKSWIGLAL